MAFASRIAERSCGFALYLLVDGIPYLFSTLRLAPTGWDAIAGEAYTWSPALLPDDEIEGVERKIEPWAGIGSSGSLAIRVLRDATWDSLRNLSLHRGHIAVVMADLGYASTTIVCDDLTGWPASGTAYMGAETVTYTSIIAATLMGVTRGCWHSEARDVRASITRTDRGGGPRIADHSLTMQRTAHVWLATGRWHRGVFTPWGASPCSDEDRELWAGPISDLAEDDHIQTITLTIGDLLDLLQREVATRLPRGKAGLNPGWNLVQIHAASRHIDHWWMQGDPSLPVTLGDVFHSAVLQRDAGGGTPEDVPDGVYEAGQIAEYVAFSLALTYATTGGTGTITAELSQNDVDGDGPYYWVNVSTDSYDTVHNSGISLVLEAGPHTLWRELGFEQAVGILSNASGTSGHYWTLHAQRLAPWLRWPLDCESLRLLYTVDDSAADFYPSPGWVDDDGADIDGYVRIDDLEIVRFASRSSYTMGGSIAFPYLTVTARDCFGSRLLEELYIDDIEDLPEIVQCVALPNTSWPRALAYLCEGYSESTRGWRGAGAYLDARYLDTTALSAMAAEVAWRAHICLVEATTLEKVFSDLLVLDQACLVPTVGSGGTLQLVPIRLELPLESDAAAAVELDADSLITTSGIQWECSESRIKNVLKGTAAGFDHAAQDGGVEITHRSVNSIATWGEGESIELDLRHLGTYQQAYDLLHGELAQRVHARWGVPWSQTTVAAATRGVGWLAELMSQAAITHDRVPSEVAVGRGVVAQPVSIYGVTPCWRGADRGRLMLVCNTPGGERLSAYAPSAYGRAVSTVDITCRDHAYSLTSEAIDALLFPAGTRVRVSKLGDETSAVSRIVDSIVSGGADATKIRLTVACGLTAPVIVELDTYDTAGATPQQQAYTHLSDGDRVVGTDPHFEYL